MPTQGSQFSGAAQSKDGGDTSASQGDKTTTVTTNDANAGNPQSLATFQPPAGEPNPFIDSGPFGRVNIGGIDLPGIIDNIDGCGTPEDWNQQKGTSGNFATSTWKGSKLAEGIKIKMSLYSAFAYAGAYKVRALLRPTRGVKPPTHAINNPIVNFGGITRVTVKDIGFPKWAKSGGYWEWEIELNEVNPSASATTGAADPSKPANGTTPGSAASNANKLAGAAAQKA